MDIHRFPTFGGGNFDTVCPDCTNLSLCDKQRIQRGDVRCLLLRQVGLAFCNAPDLTPVVMLYHCYLVLLSHDDLRLWHKTPELGLEQTCRMDAHNFVPHHLQ